MTSVLLLVVLVRRLALSTRCRISSSRSVIAPQELQNP